MYVGLTASQIGRGQK